MSNVDLSRQDAWRKAQADTALSHGDSATRSTSGGGGPTSGDMEPRVKALEDKFEKIDGKLTTIGTDLSYLKGKIDGMPTAQSFGELKGRIDSLPTMAKIGTLVAIVVAVLTVVLRWPEISAFLWPRP